jgi:GT2 family glycosyltransferase
MKTFNLQQIVPNKRTVFVLTYMGLDYFARWSREIRANTSVQFVIVDNGTQSTPESLKNYPLIQTSKNIGCAGGWNLITQVAFNKLNFEKIIITQDDAMSDISMLNAVWDNSDDNVLAGAYNRAFEFSLFGLTKKFWMDVGMFDENFLYVTYEDTDYKHRIQLANKQVKCLNYSADLNKSLTSKHITAVAKSANDYNLQYFTAKWGANCEFTHPFNDDSQSPNDLMIFDGLRDVYGDINVFPSVSEFLDGELTEFRQ